jgi:hypothetical protein
MRAQLEAERRFCGNTSEEVDGFSMPHANDREQMALCLDFRTLGGVGVPMGVLHGGKEKLKQLYIRFAHAARTHKATPGPEDEDQDQDQDQDEDEDEDEDEGEDEYENIWSMELSTTTSAPVAIDYGVVDGDEFDRCFANWVKFGKAIDWRKRFPEELKDAPSSKLCPIKQLMRLDVGSIYKALESETEKYGFLPTLARSSQANIGSLPAESFCERCISAGGLIVTPARTLLSDEEVDMLVVLRMNREFMERMRKTRPTFSGQKNNFSPVILEPPEDED